MVCVPWVSLCVCRCFIALPVNVSLVYRYAWLRPASRVPRPSSFVLRLQATATRTCQLFAVCICICSSIRICVSGQSSRTRVCMCVRSRSIPAGDVCWWFPGECTNCVFVLNNKWMLDCFFAPCQQFLGLRSLVLGSWSLVLVLGPGPWTLIPDSWYLLIRCSAIIPAALADCRSCSGYRPRSGPRACTYAPCFLARDI